jgi:hypothetical protein
VLNPVLNDTLIRWLIGDVDKHTLDLFHSFFLGFEMSERMDGNQHVVANEAQHDDFIFGNKQLKNLLEFS